MDTFQVVVRPNGETIQIHSLCPLSGEAGPCTIPTTELNRFADAGERLASGVMQPSQVIETGRELYLLLFQNEIRNSFREALSVSRERGQGLRILFQFAPSRALQEVPWELVHDDRGFLADDPGTPVARYFEQAGRLRSLKVSPPLRILLTTSCPGGWDVLDLQAEENRVRKALQGLGDRVNLDVRHHISLEKLTHLWLRAEARKRPYHIWHHAGHSLVKKLPGGGRFQLVLGKETPETVAGDKLKTLLRGCPELRAILLNVCHTGPAEGLASELASLNVPAVVGFRGYLSDPAALTFAKAFYQSLASTPIDVAMAWARRVMAVIGSEPLAWTQPVLFLRSRDPSFGLEEPLQGPERKRQASIPAVNVKFDNRSIRAKKVTQIGVAGQADQSIPEGRVEFGSESLETTELLQIGELRLSAPGPQALKSTLAELVDSARDW